RPIYDATDGLDGWVSLEVSPLLADNTASTIESAVQLHQSANKPNLYIKIPGTPAGVKAIEESIFRGVPINVTLLFSREQYVAAAEAYLRGIERRLAAGLDPKVSSVASLFVSRWDKAASDGPVGAALPAALRNRLGIAVAQQTYCAYRSLLDSPRWQKLAAAGAVMQRLLWASTGTKDPQASDILYIEALAAPATINTIPEKTLQAFADHGKAAAVLAADGGHAKATLQQFRSAGVDPDTLALRLQVEGAESFAASWRALLARIQEKSASLAGSAT
ncbi:MAG: transaldolase family protein, partial [Burkholderiaceae bacterium]